MNWRERTTSRSDYIKDQQERDGTPDDSVAESLRTANENADASDEHASLREVADTRSFRAEIRTVRGGLMRGRF